MTGSGAPSSEGVGFGGSKVAALLRDNSSQEVRRAISRNKCHRASDDVEKEDSGAGEKPGARRSRWRDGLLLGPGAFGLSASARIASASPCCPWASCDRLLAIACRSMVHAKIEL
jgi:hypothetical protein